MINTIIFDLDGVIVSTDAYHYQAWKQIAKMENIYFDKDINNRLRGVSRGESLEILLERSNKTYSLFEKEELLKIKNNVYLTLIDQLTKEDVLPGIMDLLAYLKKENYKISIGSSSKNTKKILSRLELLDTFDAIADGWDVKNSKPAPDIFLTVAKRLHKNPEECAVIEDAIAGIKAAKAAKMVAIAIGDAQKSEEADLKIDHPLELIAYLESLNKKAKEI